MDYTTVVGFIEHVGSTNMTNLMNQYTGAAAILSRQEQLLNSAEGRLNGYASMLYTIPLPVSDAIRGIVYDIATYFLYRQMEGDDVPTRIKELYKGAIESCKEIRDNKWQPPPDDSGNTVVAKASGSSYDTESVDPVFDDDEMKYY